MIVAYYTVFDRIRIVAKHSADSSARIVGNRAVADDGARPFTIYSTTIVGNRTAINFRKIVLIKPTTYRVALVMGDCAVFDVGAAKMVRIYSTSTVIAYAAIINLRVSICAVDSSS
jgi:hypothetical protein